VAGAKHVVLEIHLLVDSSIHNPYAMATDTANRVKAFVDKLYAKKSAKGDPLPRQVTTLVVSSRLADVADTDE